MALTRTMALAPAWVSAWTLRIATCAAFALAASAGHAQAQAQAPAQAPAKAPAQTPAAPLPVFDVHIHYAYNAFDAVPAPQMIAMMRKAGLRRALVSGAMAPGAIEDGAQKLHALAPDLIVPSLRPYRNYDDLRTWFGDPQILRELEQRLQRHRYAAIGEFHLSGENADHEVMRSIVKLARRHGVLMHAHSDRDAVERLFRQDPQARILWAHGGFDTPESVGQMLARHKTLWSDLAYRSDIATAGKVNEAWLELFRRFPDRFTVGTDTFTIERLHYIGEHAEYARGWLASLPRDLAERIAYRNAEALILPAWNRAAKP